MIGSEGYNPQEAVANFIEAVLGTGMRTWIYVIVDSETGEQYFSDGHGNLMDQDQMAAYIDSAKPITVPAPTTDEDEVGMPDDEFERVEDMVTRLAAELNASTEARDEPESEPDATEQAPRKKKGRKSKKNVTTASVEFPSRERSSEDEVVSIEDSVVAEAMRQVATPEDD